DRTPRLIPPGGCRPAPSSRLRRPREGTNGRRQRLRLLQRNGFGEVLEQLALLASHVGLEQLGERLEGRPERGFAVGSGGGIPQRGQTAVLRYQLLEQGRACRVIRHAAAEERKQLVFLGTEVAVKMVIVEREGLRRPALRRAGRSHRGHGRRRGGVPEPGSEHQRGAVLLPGWNQAGVPPAPWHGAVGDGVAWLRGAWIG